MDKIQVKINILIKAKGLFCFMFEVKLISLYFYICEKYEEKLKYNKQKGTKNTQY